MKKLLLAAGVVMVSWAVVAQTYITTNISASSLTFTNAVPGNSTNSTAYLDIPAENWDEVALQISYARVGTTTNTVSFVIRRSVNGSVWDTEAPITLRMISLAATTNAVVTLTTNISIGSVRYLRLTDVQVPTATNAVTGLDVWAGYKPWRHGLNVR